MSEPQRHVLIFSPEDELLREFIEWLFEDVDVVVTKSVEVCIGEDRMRLIEGEERKMPRWLALWLARRNVVLLPEEDVDKLIGKFQSLELKQRRKPSLVDVPHDFLIQFKYVAERMGEERFTQRLVDRLVEFVKMRLLKIFSSAAVLRQVELPMVESVFYRFAMRLIERWLDALRRMRLSDTLKRIFGEGQRD